MTSVSAKLEADLAALVTGHAFGETLAQSARVLAARLDSVGDRDLAAVHRELRETLAELAALKAGGADEFGDALSVPTEVRDPENGE